MNWCRLSLYPPFALEFVLTWIHVSGGRKQELLGQLKPCPASADHISPIHPCHVDDACMCDCLTFLSNENSICGESDMVDVSCRHCTHPRLRGHSGCTLTVTHGHTESPLRLKKRQMFLCSPFSREIQWQAELLNNHFLTSLRQHFDTSPESACQSQMYCLI